ncbi:MAG: PTS sugar transporter subunit IIA [Firmicutes bacterium]|nr:PTS sugar transporter subunit IIA [Bacillota bacterium]
MTDCSLLVSPALVRVGLQVSSSDQVLDELSTLLEQNGAVKPSYRQAVRERERLYPTGLPTREVGVAIPHADAQHVLKPAIALATLVNPVRFACMGNPDTPVDVGVVLMLAVKDAGGQVGILQKLVEVFQAPGFLLELRSQPDSTAAASMLEARLGSTPGQERG